MAGWVIIPNVMHRDNRAVLQERQRGYELQYLSRQDMHRVQNQKIDFPFSSSQMPPRHAAAVSPKNFL